MPSSPLQLQGVIKGDELFAGFFSLITGPMIRTKNKRIYEVLPNDVDQGISSKKWKIETKAKEIVPTIKCCIGWFLESINIH